MMFTLRTADSILVTQGNVVEARRLAAETRGTA